MSCFCRNHWFCLDRDSTSDGSITTSSPWEGQIVTGVLGIVTAVGRQTFIFQDDTGDGDDTTSDALVVFTGGSTTTPSVSVGDLVNVSGTMAEYTPEMTPDGALSSITGHWLSTTQIGNNPGVYLGTR
jgi:predicted extracellular nuclease